MGKRTYCIDPTPPQRHPASLVPPRGRLAAAIPVLIAVLAAPALAQQSNGGPAGAADPVVSIHEITKPPAPPRRPRVYRHRLHRRVAAPHAENRVARRDHVTPPPTLVAAHGRRSRDVAAREHVHPARAVNQPPRHAAPREALAGSAGELNDRAFRLLRAGRYADAEPLARRALALQPDYPHAQFNLGWSLLAQGRAREAIAPLRRSAAGEPERWEPAQKLGEAYAAIGNRTRAAAAFARSRALRHAPAFASTHRAPDLVPAVARSRRPVRPVDTALTPRNPRARDGARRSPSALRNPRAREARGTNDE